jgi:outer membrane murein-binding lipoprotein Lpp
VIWISSHRWAVLGSIVAVVLVAGAYFIGKGSVDTHSSEVADLQGEIRDAQGKLEAEEAELRAAEGDLSSAKGEVSVAEEEVIEAKEDLAAERSFKGEGAEQNAANAEYNTDYPWGAAGEAGDFIFKPTGWEQDGSKWVLTVEAKNISHEPKEPFCGGAESVVLDAGENQYTGEADLGNGAADCGSELQPGTTATYKADFDIPANSVPVVVGIYGEYEQEEEAKLWELPH